MKQGWEIKKLGEVCEINLGKTPPRSDARMWDKERQSKNIWLSIADLNSAEGGYVNDRKEYISDEAKQNIKIVKKGTLLLSFKLTLGKTAFAGTDLYTNEAIAALPFKDKSLNKFFLKYYFESFDWQKFASGDEKVLGKTLNKKKLDIIPIPVPSLLEQGRIVEVLDAAFAKIDALKENAQKNLENAKALFQQVLKQELTPKPNWQTKKLSEVCETITDFVAAGSFAALRENVKYNSEKDFAQLVRTTDIKSNFTKGKFVYVSKSAFDFLYRVNLDKQSIVLPNVGGNCGEVYIVNPSQLPYEHNVLGPNAILVRSDTESNEFLSYAFKGQEFQKSLLGIINSIAQPKFNKTSLKKLLVCLPDKAEQNLIVKKLHSVEQMCSQIEANAEKTIAECDALKQAVLHRAFNGEL